MPIKAVGFDLALNHGAAVELTDGKLTNFWYYTDVAGAAKRSEEHGVRMVLPKTDDRQAKAMHRLAWVEHWIDKTVLIPAAPDFVGIEDYALDGGSHGSHYKGELGGIARILVWFRGIPFRLHDPISIKMFTTRDGTAKKDLVEQHIRERYGGDFSAYNPPKNERSGKINRQTSEDLADAMAVANLVWVEQKLREGKMALSDLEHPKEIQVFNRVTKSYPINLLGREWIHNDKGASKPHAGLRPRIEAKLMQLEEAGASRAAEMLRELLKDG